MQKHGYIKLYRADLFERMRSLSDREIVLLLIYALLAGWDKKHQHRYSKVEKTIAEIKNNYLPHWSTGKISTVTSRLIKKGFITRNRSCITIHCYEIYRAKTGVEAEAILRKGEEKIQYSENHIQSPETGPLSLTREEVIRKYRDMRKTFGTVQNYENADHSKEP